MSGLRPSGLHINKPAIFGLIGVFLIIILVYKFYLSSEPISLNTHGLPSLLGGHNHGAQQQKGNVKASVGAHPVVWNVTLLPEVRVLDDEAKKKLLRKSEIFQVDISGTKIPIYIQQVINSELKTSGDILFLHGAKFSSEDWQKIGALDQVANWGFRAIAVDLPGKGKSTQALDTSSVTKFLPSLIKTLEISHPVIIAPSMSGQYAIPYLFTEPEKGKELAKGFVPVAPAGASSFKDAFQKSQLPTLIVYGSKDPAGGRTLEDLGLLQKSIEAKIPDAGHACYLDQPALFFRALHAFLKQINS